MEALFQDFRYAVRTLARTPGFTLAAALTLAFGIGANSVTFGVLDTLLLRAPPHLQDADRLVRLYFSTTYASFGRSTSPITTYPNYTDLRDGARGCEGLAAHFWTPLSFGTGVEAQEIDGAAVTHTFFSLLGVRPHLGRFFAPDEDRPGAAPVAVLGYGLWRREFGADTTVVGREVQIGRTSYAVVGVAPKGFTGVDLKDVGVWLPIESAASNVFFPGAVTSRGSYWIRVIGRLRLDASYRSAAGEATVVFRRVNAGQPMFDSASAAVELGPIQLGRGPQRSPGVKVATWVSAQWRSSCCSSRCGAVGSCEPTCWRVCRPRPRGRTSGSSPSRLSPCCSRRSWPVSRRPCIPAAPTRLTR